MKFFFAFLILIFITTKVLAGAPTGDDVSTKFGTLLITTNKFVNAYRAQYEGQKCDSLNSETKLNSEKELANLAVEVNATAEVVIKTLDQWQQEAWKHKKLLLLSDFNSQRHCTSVGDTGFIRGYFHELRDNYKPVILEIVQLRQSSCGPGAHYVDPSVAIGKLDFKFHGYIGRAQTAYHRFVDCENDNTKSGP